MTRKEHLDEKNRLHAEAMRLLKELSNVSRHANEMKGEEFDSQYWALWDEYIRVSDESERHWKAYRYLMNRAIKRALDANWPA